MRKWLLGTLALLVIAAILFFVLAPAMVEKSMKALRIEDAIGTTMSVIFVIFMGAG